jgi:hypothetical protein
LRINADRPRPAIVNDKPQGGQFMLAQPAGDQPDDAIWGAVRKLWPDYLNPVFDHRMADISNELHQQFSARDQPSATGDHNWWNQMRYDVGEGELT